MPIYIPTSSIQSSFFSTSLPIVVISHLFYTAFLTLKSGYSVDYEGLGRFYVTLTSEGADTVDEFSTSLIKQVNLRFDVDNAASAEVNTDVEFEYSMTRQEQAKAKKAAKAALPNSTGDNSGGGNDNGGGNGGGNGEITE